MICVGEMEFLSNVLVQHGVTAQMLPRGSLHHLSPPPKCDVSSAQGEKWELWGGACIIRWGSVWCVAMQMWWWRRHQNPLPTWICILIALVTHIGWFRQRPLTSIKRTLMLTSKHHSKLFSLFFAQQFKPMKQLIIMISMLFLHSCLLPQFVVFIRIIHDLEEKNRLLWLLRQAAGQLDILWGGHGKCEGKRERKCTMMNKRRCVYLLSCCFF